MCKQYTTTEFPDFKPKCKLGHKASLRCHSENKFCMDYSTDESNISQNQKSAESN